MTAGPDILRAGEPALALARPLLPPEVALAATDPREDHHRALPEETAALGRVAPARAREFAAGRVAIRTAQARAGLALRPVPPGPDRAPRWPAGQIGSLAHCASACLAAVAPAGAIRALGLDLEEDRPLTPELIPEISTAAERAWLARLPGPEQGAGAMRLFVAKEAAYKAQYALSGRIFDFQMLSAPPPAPGGPIRLRFVQDVPPFAAGAEIAVRLGAGAGLIVAAACIAGPALPAPPDPALTANEDTPR